MERVITYIDGFNLYFGMKAQYNNKYLWLDVEALSNSLLLPDQSLVATKYFTSMVTNQPDKEGRQRTYLDALRHSQLPDNISKPDGFVLSRPATWI